MPGSRIPSRAMSNEIAPTRGVSPGTASAMQTYKGRWGTDVLHATQQHNKMFAVKDAFNNGGSSVSMSLREGRPPRARPGHTSHTSGTPKPPHRKLSAQDKETERHRTLVLQQLGDSVVNGTPALSSTPPAGGSGGERREGALPWEGLAKARGPLHLRGEVETADYGDSAGLVDSVDTLSLLDHLIGPHSTLSAAAGGDTDDGGGSGGGRGESYASAGTRRSGSSKEAAVRRISSGQREVTVRVL